MITLPVNARARFAILAFMLLVAGGLNAQTAPPAPVTVTGLVKSGEDGIALPNVNIWRKGSVNEGTVTDTDGRFTYPKPLAAGDVLIFSYVGMDRKEYVVPADYQSGAVIDMGLDMHMISELVVTGEPRIESGTKAHRGIFRKFLTALR